MTDLLPNWDTHSVESLRKFSKVCLVVADLDGTLLRLGTNTLSETIRTQRRTSKYHVSLTLATGRSFNGAVDLLGQLAIPKGTPLILYNGSLVVQASTRSVIYQRIIPGEILRRVIKTCLEYPVRVLAYVYENPIFGSDGLTVQNEYVVGWTTTSAIEVEFNNMLVQWQNDSFPTENIEHCVAILVDVSADLRSREIIEKRLNAFGEVSVTRSGLTYVEVRPRGSNKGAALDIVTEHLRLRREEVLAIGDNDNDCEMLDRAGIGVAVAKASQAALNNSDYVSSHGAAEAVIEVLRLVRHAKRYFSRRV